MDRKIESFKRIMKSVDGREFTHLFLLDSCGIDTTLGLPNSMRDDFTLGKHKVGIDLLNILIYHCKEEFFLMNEEALSRRKIDGRNN